MTTRIESGGPATLVTTGPTAARTTAEPARPFQQVMRAGAAAVVASAESAATRLPGGPILAAAFRPTTAGVAGAQLSPEGPGAAGGGAGASAPAGASGIEGVLAQNADQNLYFIALQERISQENRHFTTVSNVLKARHETVKNAIGNLR